MLERSKWILKIACLALAALLLYQLVQIGIRLNPLAHVAVPELPSLPPEPAGQPAPAPLVSATPPISRGAGSNNPMPSIGSNSSPSALVAGTNAPPAGALAQPVTNSPTQSKTMAIDTNFPGLAAIARSSNLPPAVAAASGTNPPPQAAATNAVVSQNQGSKNGPAAPGPMAMAGGFNPGQRMMMASLGAVILPPAIQARVDRIVDSEILGPVIRPQPAALMGIAGNFAFVRAPTGQTGLIKEGDDLGGLKLLRIGTNRVLIEEQGQKRELTIFSGYGGESLLPKQDTSHETNK
jgi:hypothetical protein